MSLKCFVILLLPVCALGQPIWMDDGITPNGEMRRAPAEPGAGSFERNDWDALGRADRSAREPENPFGLEPLIPELNEAKKQTNLRFGIGESASKPAVEESNTAAHRSATVLAPREPLKS